MMKGKRCFGATTALHSHFVLWTDNVFTAAFRLAGKGRVVCGRDINWHTTGAICVGDIFRPGCISWMSSWKLFASSYGAEKSGRIRRRSSAGFFLFRDSSCVYQYFIIHLQVLLKISVSDSLLPPQRRKDVSSRCLSNCPFRRNRELTRKAGDIQCLRPHG